MKKLLLLFFVLAASSLSAQNYKLFVLEPVGGYAALPKSAERLAMPWGNIDENYAYISVPGFSINIFGKKYTLSETSKLGVSILGNLKIEDDTSLVIIDGYFTGLDSVSPASSVVYQVIEAQSGRAISIEYRMLGYSGCNDSSHVTFKMTLEETTGNIIFDYGENVIVCDSALGDQTGPWVGIFRSNLDVTKFYKINWLSGNPNAPKIVTTSLPVLGGVPPSGKSYAFVPPTNDIPQENVITSLPRIIYGTDVIALHTESGAAREAVIYDELGRAVRKFSIASSAMNTQIPTEHLSRGVYLIFVDGTMRQMIWSRRFPRLHPPRRGTRKCALFVNKKRMLLS
jgi:hypothetical protein